MRFEWRPAAQAQLRAVDKEHAMKILQALTRYRRDGQGDVTKLTDTENEFRLRVGDYRVRFERKADVITVLRVAHRSEAYR